MSSLVSSNQNMVVVRETTVLDAVIEQPVHSANSEYESALGEIQIPEEYLLRTELPAGEQRMLHVSPGTIRYNNNRDANYPTIIVKDDAGNEIGRFHGVVVCGSIALRQKKEDGQPAVAIVTRAAITCFVDERQNEILLFSESCNATFPAVPNSVDESEWKDLGAVRLN